MFEQLSLSEWILKDFASKWKTKIRASKIDLSKKKKLFLSDLSKPMIGMSYGERGKAARLSVVFI
jgi:hypothetical protein